MDLIHDYVEQNFENSTKNLIKMIQEQGFKTDQQQQDYMDIFESEKI